MIRFSGNTDDEWENVTDALTEVMGRINKTGKPWTATVENFGWRNQNGYKPAFKAQNGRQLLMAILPHTDCTFSIEVDMRAKVITVDNAHHDKPCGGEIYTIRMAK